MDNIESNEWDILIWNITIKNGSHEITYKLLNHCSRNAALRNTNAHPELLSELRQSTIHFGNSQLEFRQGE
jgi:hypothetical protein